MKLLLFWGPSDGYMSSESRPKYGFLFFSPLERLPPLSFLLLSFLYRFPSKPYIWRLGEMVCRHCMAWHCSYTACRVWAAIYCMCVW